MKGRRVSKINSLLREVFSEVIRVDFDRPGLTHLLTVTDVEVTPDLQHAKVFISVIGTEAVKKQTLETLNHAKGYLAVLASKKVRLRFFPEIIFKLDDGVERQMRIEGLLKEIHEKEGHSDEDPTLDDLEDSEEKIQEDLEEESHDR
jgi:ribosome-binding factor A